MGQWWRCRRCGLALGLGVGRMLWLSLAVAVGGQVRVQCRGCELWQTWYAPSVEPVVAPEDDGLKSVK